MSWILVIFVTIGAMSNKDSMALTNIPGFGTQQECQTAGQLAVNKFGTGTKRADFVCVSQKK